MISLYIKGQLCDAPPGGIDATFTYSIKNAQESGSIRGAATYTVSLPATPGNNQIFGAYWNLDASDFIPSIPALFDAQNYNDCHLQIAGNEVFRGKCRLLEFSKEKYQLQLIGANLTWGAVFQTRKLREVDINPANWRYERWRYYNDICTYDKALNYYEGFVSPQFDSDFAMSALTLDELHLQFQTFAFPIVNYGDTLDLDGLSQPMIEFYKIQASAFIAPLMFAHFAQLGYKLESRFFRNAMDGKSLALLYTSLSVPSLVLAEITVPAGDPTNTQIFGIPPFLFSVSYSFTSIITENYDSVNNAGNFEVANQALYASYSPVQYEWQFQSFWKITLTSDPLTGVLVNFFVDVLLNNGPVLATAASPNLVIGANTTGIFYFNVDLGGLQFMVNGDFINIHVRYTAVTLGPGGGTVKWEEADASYFKAQPATMEGIITDLRDGLPEITVAELLKDLVSMFNLWVYTDEKLNTVYIETYDEFFKDISKDISLSLDRTDAIEQKKYSGEFNRELYFQFAEDSNDAMLAQYLDSHQQNFGTGFLTNADLTTRETGTIETALVAPTLSGPWDDVLFPRFRIPYLLNDLAQVEYATGEFAPRVVRVSPPLTRTTASVGANYLKINFTVDPQGPVCAGPIGFTGAPTWTSFMTSPTTGTITYEYYPHAYFFDAVSNQDLLNLPFNDIRVANDVYAPASVLGLIALYYYNWWQHVQTGRILSVKILLHRLTIDDLTDFRELIWLDKHQCYMSEIKNYKPGASQLVECELIMIK